MKTLVLGIGNDLLADDAVGIIVAEHLAPRLEGRADVIATPVHGVALLDSLIGYDRLVMVDAVQTGRYPPGTVFELSLEDLRPVGNPSPHYTGVPDLADLARRLGLPFPTDTRIFAVEAPDIHTIGGEMTQEVAQAIPQLCELAENAVLSAEPVIH
jgi:hydrogenase maturation protease